MREDFERKQHEADYHDIETPEHTRRDPYVSTGIDDDDDHYDRAEFDDLDAGFRHEPRREREDSGKNKATEKLSTPLILATAANMYLDTTVTKFL